jgi:hypothetical protein
MPLLSPRSRWGRAAAATYLGLAAIAGVLAIGRLLVSTEMPGLAVWELLVLALPWTLALETSVGRQSGGVLLGAVILGGVLLNTGALYAIASLVAHRLKRRHT